MTQQEKEARAALGVDDSTKDVGKFIPTGEKVDNVSQEVRQNLFDMSGDIGYVPISKESLPSKGMFYDPNISVTIRAATTKEIKYYSSMNDEDPFEVERHVSQMLNTCCRVVKGDSQILSFKDLSEFDKVYAFFAIRDRTFLNNKRESNLNTKSECPQCGHINSHPISNETFGYYTIADSVLKYYSEEERCFVLSDPELGDKPLKMYIPTVGVTSAIMEYIKKKETEKQSGEGGYYNAMDLTIIMYTTENWRDIDSKDKYIKSRLKEMESWTEERYLIATEMTKRLKVGIKPNIRFKCEKCGGEINAAIRFQQWRTLFSNESVISRFFEDSESDDSEQDS